MTDIFFILSGILGLTFLMAAVFAAGGVSDGWRAALFSAGFGLGMLAISMNGRADYRVLIFAVIASAAHFFVGLSGLRAILTVRRVAKR